MAKKSYTKRIKVTKTGKLLRRKKGLGHAKSKKSSKVVRQKRRMKKVSKPDEGKVSNRINK